MTAILAAMTGSVPSVALPTSTPDAAMSAAPKPSTPLARREHARLRESAPADAYFGRLKMSYLGIENVFRMQSAVATPHTVDPDIVNKVKDADAALQEWVKRYPADPELAHSYFLAATVFGKIWLKEYQDKAWRYMHAVVDKYPASYFGKQVKKNLAVGFTEHYYSDALACTGTPGTPAAAATANSTASPAPTATQSAAPGQPKVQFVAPPCASPAATTAAPSAAPISVPVTTGSAAPRS